MVMTSVISVRGKDRDQLLADRNFIYVGRAVGKNFWKESEWGNPYGYLGKHGSYLQFCASLRVAARCTIIQYTPASKEFEKFKTMVMNIGILSGMTLGCWCGEWQHGQPPIPCHACELAIFANSIDPEDYLERAACLS